MQQDPLSVTHLKGTALGTLWWHRSHFSLKQGAVLGLLGVKTSLENLKNPDREQVIETAAITRNRNCCEPYHCYCLINIAQFVFSVKCLFFFFLMSIFWRLRISMDTREGRPTAEAAATGDAMLRKGKDR